jgi:hypothetical protein
VSDAKLKEACDLVEATLRKKWGPNPRLLFEEGFVSYEDDLAQGWEESSLYLLLTSDETEVQ